MKTDRIFSDDESLRIFGLKDFVKGKLTVSPLPEGLREQTVSSHAGKDRFVIAGGCFTSILLNENVNDFDLFLLGYDEDLLKDSHIAKQLDEKENREPGRFYTFDHANYTKNPNILKTYLDTHSRIQYIFTKYKTRKELVGHFDFVHCGISYDLGEDKLYITREAYDVNMLKKLIVSKSAPFISQSRIEKFKRRGFNFEAERV
jgi:hypothetical protein